MPLRIFHLWKILTLDFQFISEFHISFMFHFCFIWDNEHRLVIENIGGGIKFFVSYLRRVFQDRYLRRDILEFDTNWTTMRFSNDSIIRVVCNFQGSSFGRCSCSRCSSSSRISLYNSSYVCFLLYLWPFLIHFFPIFSNLHSLYFFYF